MTPARALSSRGSPSTSSASIVPHTPISPHSSAPEMNPAVIVGLACRVPGAQNPSQLWKNIEAQVDLRQKIPSDRFNIDAFCHPDATKKGTVRMSIGMLSGTT
jgi:hypothetical protein